jgi:hypothetical protein
MSHKKEGIRMKSLSLVIFLLVGLAIGSYKNVWAIDYRWFGENDEGMFFYDIESIAYPSKDTVRVWIREVFSLQGRRAMSRALGGGYENLDHSISQEELNCKDKTFRQLSRTIYTQDGSILSSSKNLAEPFQPIQPNSVNELLYEAVCEQEGR